MDVGGGDQDQESSLFQAFVVPSVCVENKNVNKTNDPIKPSTLSDREVLKADNQPKSTEVKFERFEQFSTLPIGLSKYVAPDLIGTPLEDIDPFYKDKQTFIVVNRNKALFRFSSAKSLWMFRPNNVLRQKACRILTDPFWALFMIFVILFNCFISLIIPGAGPLFDIPWELIFLVIFILEFAIKVIARGFVLAQFTYLRDPWNCFDLLIIIHAITAICVDPEKAIYECPFLCELRVLKLCSLSLGLRRTINIYWQSLVKMRDLLLYILFAMVVISVICLEMYMGILGQRCVKIPRNVRSDAQWSDFTTDSGNFFYEGGVHRACGNSSGAQDCPPNYVCLAGNNLNPNYNITSFDTFARSFFLVFRLIQRDFWEESMQYLTATAGPWHILLFIVLIYYVSFQLCALLWTPIALAYNHLKDEQWENDLLNDLNEAQQQSTANSVESKVKNPGCFAKFQRFVFNIIYNPFAVLFIIICILLNTLFMALDHHDMSEDLESVLIVGNYFFVVVFVIEAILKLTALGPSQYFRDEWNTFDFIVTALGVIELSVENVQGLSVLRAFRLLRPLRLGKIVPAFELLIRRVRYLFTVLRHQTIILCMFIYIFVVFGCRAFGKSYSDNVHLFYGHKVPRWNFTDIFHSFMVVFRSLCGEWVESLYDCMLATDATSIVYFCALALIGSFVIMHLFVALILTNDDSSVLSSNNTPDSNSHAKQSTIKSTSSSNRKFNLHTFLKEKLLEPNIQKIYDANKPIKNDMESLPVDAPPPSTTITLSSNKPDDKHQSHPKDNKKSTVVLADLVEKNETGASSVVVVAPVATEDDDEDDATINKWSKIRVIALKFNESTYFGYIVLAIIFIASIALVHTVNSFSLTLAGTSFVVELAFCIVMIIEFISKTISCGWKSYFKNISCFCLIDLFNTIVPIVGLCTPSNAVATNQTILILKALRPLSIVSRCSGLKIIVTTIAHQARMLCNSLVICGAFWLIFAIMGVQMFAGKFYQCVTENQTRLGIDFVPARNTCIDKQYEWTNSPVNFDNVIMAYLSLLQVATFKGWIRLIQDAVDSRDVDAQPLRDSNIYMFNYFVIFIVLGVFVCANLIIGILVKQILQGGNLSDVFDSSKKSTETRVSHSNASNNGQSTQDVSTTSQLATLAQNPYFDWIAFAICIFYIIALAFDQYMLGEKCETCVTTIQYIDNVCAILFIIETALRLHSLRRTFLLSFWNFYDAVTVILLLIELFMIEFTHSNVVSVSMLRVIRVIRFNSLFVPYSSQLKLGLAALNRSKTVAWNLCLFLLLIVFVYALIGSSAFKRVTNVTPINDQISFHTVGQAIILLIQISTTAGWDGVYNVLVAEYHYNAFVIFLYLWSFIYICILIIVNLVLTIILNYYTNAYDVETETKKLPANEINDLNEKWSILATRNEPHFINKAQLPLLINRLDKESSLRTSVIPTEENLQLLGIPIRNEQQLYRGDVLIALNQIRKLTQSTANK